MRASAVTIKVRVTPRADRNAVIGFRESDGVLLLRTTAPPVDGAANAACLQLLADLLGVRRNQVTLVGGATSRDKRFAITEISEEAVKERLATKTVIVSNDR